MSPSDTQPLNIVTLKQPPANPARSHANVGEIIRSMLEGRLDPQKPIDLGQFNGDGRIIEQLFQAYQTHGSIKVWEMMGNLTKADPGLGILVFAPPQPVLPGITVRRFYTAAEYMDRPPVKYLDDQKTIQQRGLTTIFGKPGRGKSLWIVHKLAKIAEKRVILLVLAEGQNGMPDRLRAEKIVRNAPLSNGFKISDRHVDLRDEEAVRRFIAEVKNEGIQSELIVFDTLSGCMPGADENHPTDMTKMLDHCKLIIAELNTAVLLVHHSTKDGKGYRGHSSLHGQSDIMLEIDQDKKGIVTVSSFKSKDGPPLEMARYQIEAVITRKDPETGEDIRGAALVALNGESKLEPAEDEGSKLTPEQHKVLKALETAPTGMCRTDLLKALEMKAGGKWQAIIRALMDTGYVSQAEPKHPYVITEAGKVALSLTSK